MDVLNPIRLSVFCSNPRLKSVNQKILFGSYQWLGWADTQKTVMVRKYSNCMGCKCWPSAAGAHSHNNPAGGHRGPGLGRVGPWGACLT